MSASAFCGIQRENIVCFDDEAAFSHYKVLFETFKETCSDNVSYKAVVNTMNQEDYLKENIKEVPVFQSIEKQKLVFLEQAQPEDEVEYEIVADVKKMQELVKTQFQNHSERVIKNDEWGISDRLVNYPAVSITSNKITSLTKDLSKRAIICRIGGELLGN